MDAYLFRNIPDDLWHQAKVRAMTERVSVRDVLLAGLRLYVAGEFEVARTDDEKPAATAALAPPAR